MITALVVLILALTTCLTVDLIKTLLAIAECRSWDDEDPTMNNKEILLKTLEQRTGYSVSVIKTIFEQAAALGYELKPRRTAADVQLPNLDATKRESGQQVEAVLSDRVKLSHRLPKSFFRAALIDQLGLLELLDGNPYQETDERVQRIKAAALHLAKEIYRYFTLSIRPDQTGIEIVNKLLRKLGLKAEVLCKVGSRGQQVKIWGLPDLCNPIRVRLARAATERAGGDPDSILAELPQSFYDAASGPEPPPEPPPEH